MKRYDTNPLVTNVGLLCVQEESASGKWVKYDDAQAAIQAAVLAEREACAKLAEPLRLADTIRARSKS